MKSSLIKLLSLLFAFCMVICVFVGCVVVDDSTGSNTGDSTTDSGSTDSTDTSGGNSSTEESEKTADEIINELLKDQFAGTGYEEIFEDPRYAEEWEKVLLKRKPLEIGETYVETFDTDNYSTSRLYPEVFVNGASVERIDAVEGVGSGKNLKISTNGDVDENYDAVVFRGMEFVPGARYRITITAKTMADGRNYFVGFRGGQDVYAFNFSGTEGYTQTASGTVTLGTASYTGLVIMIAGGDSADLIIDDLTVERLQTLEKIDLTSFGSKVTFDFNESLDYVSANNSSLSLIENGEGKAVQVTKINGWQGLDTYDITLKAGGMYKVTYDIKMISGNTAMAFATMSSAANGSYQDVGNQIFVTNEWQTITTTYTLKNFDDYFFNFSFSDGSCVFAIDNLTIECIDPESLKYVDLRSLNSKYENDFSGETANFVTSGSATVKVVDGALKVTKTAQWQGLKGVNFKFANGMTYKFSFDLTVSKMGSTDYFELLFADGTAEKVSHGLATYVKVGETVKVEFYVTLLADATEFLIGCWDGGAEYTIDNFAIENTVKPTEPEEPEIPDEPVVEIVDLTTLNSKYENDFSSETTNFVTSGSATVKVVDGALKVTKTAQWQGLKGVNFKFAKGMTYKFSFDLTVSKMGSTDYFELLFADGTAEKVSHGLATYVKVGETVKVEFYVTLLADATEFLIGCWDGGAEYTIDNFVIENTVEPTEPEEPEIPDEPVVEIVDLTTLNSKYENDFSKETTNFVTSGSANVEVVDGALKVTKTAQWQGLKGVNFKFAKGMTYKFSFDLTVSKMGSTDYFELLFADGTAEKVSHGLATYVKVGETVKVEFYVTLLADATEFLIGCWDGGAEYTIDNFVIENTVEPTEPEEPEEPEIPEEKFEVIDLTQTGVKYEQNFNNVSETFINNYFVGVNGTVSLVDGGVKVVKTGAWNGFKFQNIKFGANATYIITMDITLLKTHDWDKDNFFFTFGDGTEYKVATNIGGQIALNETKTVTFTVTLGDYADYVLDVSVYGGDTEFIIDNLVIENYMEIEEPEVPEEPVVTEIDLTKLNSKYENDFSKETANFVTSGSANVEVKDGVLSVVKTAQWQGLKGVNFRFANGMTYKFSFDLTVSKMGSTDYFEVLFADGTAEKVSHGLATYVKVGETVKVEFYVTLLADATEFLIGCWDGGAEYTIDNFVIENTVEPTEPEIPEEKFEEIDLTQTGAKYEQNFDNVTEAYVNNYFAGINATVVLADGGVKVTKTAQWDALKSQNIKFAGNATYKFIIDITLLDMHAYDVDNFFFTFGEGTEYKVSTQIGGQLALNETKTVTFMVTLGDYADYAFNISTFGGNTTFIIDNILIENYVAPTEPEIPEEPEVTEVDLTTLNSKYENDFSSETTNFVTSGSATVKVVDGALKVTKTAQWQGLKGVNFKFAKGMTYKFNFDLTVSKMGSTDYFEVLFADGTAEKVSHGLATYVKVGETVKVEFYVTLLADATEFLIGCWDGGAEYAIDNFAIENTVEPVDLTQLGSKNTFTFDDGLSYVSANNSIISIIDNGEGKAVKVEKTAGWQGLDFCNILFKASGTYKVSFDIRLISGSAGMAFATMSSAANGSYQDVGNQISVTGEWQTITVEYTLKDFDDYFLNFSFSDGSCVFVVDNLTIECVA